jgi:pyoverdine/dityrosine biosynthesis protein Dit1
MLCPPINQTLPNYPFQENNRNKVPDKLPKFHEGTALENKAYTNLCELS